MFRQFRSREVLLTGLTNKRTSFQGEEEVNTGNYSTFAAPIDVIPLHLRGGHIVPTQLPANNTHFRFVRSLIGFCSAQRLTTRSV